MKKLSAVAAASLLLLAACGREAANPSEPAQTGAAAAGPGALTAMHGAIALDTVATGLNNPRGLKFGPDGDLYVAEGGTGGTNSTVGQCLQVPQVGPYTGGYTSRISKIDRHGNRTTVVDSLPSSATSAVSGSLTSGVADVAFIGRTLYAVLAGAGCSHGVPDVPNAVIRVHRNGTWSIVADLSAFVAANPAANPDPDDFEPDGTWYGLVARDGYLYTTEPNHQEVDRVSPRTGRIKRLVDVSVAHNGATGGWIGPTALIADRDGFVFGTLGPFPVVPGSESIFDLDLNGRYRALASGFSTVLGLASDRAGRIYVLESMTQPGFPGPQDIGAGMVVRVKRGGAVDTVATGFSFPSAMTYGPDGNLYVSDFGFGTPPGTGQIVRIRLGHDHD
ncbi:MAG TPA: ScyD/ScyE family protein [Gemmatimonadales bacterium]|nr:ScyD/ScyE family protein [Gemmatimonadales bacterium]